MKSKTLSLSSSHWVSHYHSCKELSETQNDVCRASLVAQWLRIHLPVQGTRVWQALVQEDPTCRGATKPVRHNYWACALEPVSHNCWAYVPWLLKPARLEPMLRNKRSHHNERPTHRNGGPRTTTKSSPCSLQLERACVQQQRPNAAKNKLNKNK